MKFPICICLLIPVTLAVINYERRPSDTSVREGGTATFNCIRTENGFAVSTIWIVYLVSRPGAFVSVQPGNVTNLPGASEVILSTDKTELRIIGVQRSLDGARVDCRVASDIRSRERVTPSSDIVHISVLCELILKSSTIEYYHYSCNMSRHTLIISVIEFVLECACICVCTYTYISI